MITKISDPITWEKLTAVLDYSPETGVFTWRESRNYNSALKGNIAGSIENTGYISIRLGKKAYLAHRLAWLYCFQEWPENVVDHIDRNKSNNTIDNLRDICQMANSRNRHINKNNTSGYVGVYKKRNKWTSEIIISGIKYRLGTFNTPEEASAAYKNFEKDNSYENISIG